MIDGLATVLGTSMRSVVSGRGDLGRVFALKPHVWQLILLALLLPWLAVATAFGLWSWKDFTSSVEGARLSAAAAAHVYEEHARLSIGRIDTALLQAADMVEELGIEGLRSEAAWRRLKSLTRGMPESGAVFVYDTHGDTVATSAKFPPPAFNASDRAYFQQILAGTEDIVIGPVLQGRTIHEWFFPVARAIKDGAGKPIGVIQAGVEPAMIATALPKSSTGVIATVGLYRIADGALVARQPMQQEPPMEVVAPEARDALASPGASDWYGWTPDANGQRLAVATRVEGYPLLAVGTLDAAAIYAAPRARLLWRILALLGVGILQWALVKRILAARRHAEAAQSKLRNSELRNRTLVHATSAITWSCPPTGLHVVPQPEWMDFTGQTVEEMLDDGWTKAVHPEDRADAAAAWQEAANCGHPYKHEHRIRRRDGEWRWMRVEATLVPDGSDGGAAWFGMNVDITERKQAESDLRASRRQLALALQAGQLGFWDWDVKSGGVQFGGRWAAMLGYEPNEIEPHVSSWENLVHPDEKASVMATLADHMEGRTPHYECEHRLKHKDGSWRWILDSGEVVERDAEGRPLRAIGTHTDVTSRHEVQEALRKSEERFQLSMEATNDGIWDWNVLTNEVYFSPSYFRILGLEPGGFPGTIAAWKERIHPEDVERTVAENMACVEGRTETFSVEYRLRDRSGGWRWILGRGKCVTRDAQGRATRLIGTHIDITERKQREEQVQLLLREVNHRSKNLLAVVQAVAWQTASRDPADFVERFTERLQSLSASQDLLVRSEWRGVEVEELARSQLAHFKDLIGGRIMLQGPPLRLAAGAAQSIGIALHELATNAGKYGALSNESGQVTLGWRVAPAASGAPRFLLSWTERGGPQVVAPKRRGFGSTVIQKMPQVELDAEIVLDFAPDGLNWQMSCEADRVLEPAGAEQPEAG